MGKFGCAILMDLSKAFEKCIKNFLAKLHAFALLIINIYRKIRWQRTKINNLFGSWVELLHGGSI